MLTSLLVDVLNGRRLFATPQKFGVQSLESKLPTQKLTIQNVVHQDDTALNMTSNTACDTARDTTGDTTPGTTGALIVGRKPPALWCQFSPSYRCDRIAFASRKTRAKGEPLKS